MSLPDAETYLDFKMEEPPPGIEYIGLRRKLFGRREVEDAILRAQRDALKAAAEYILPYDMGYDGVAVSTETVAEEILTLMPKEKSDG